MAGGPAFFFPLHHLVQPVPPGALAVLSAKQLREIAAGGSLPARPGQQLNGARGR